MRCPRKGGRPSREVAGRRRVAAGVNARPTSGREVSGRGRESAAAGVAAKEPPDRQRGWPLGEGKRPGREGAAAQDAADVCIQNIYFVAAKVKRRKETQAKSVWK